MNLKRAGSWMTIAMAAMLGGCVYPGDIDGKLINRYRQATAEKGPQPRQAASGIGMLKPAETETGKPLAVEGTVVSKVVKTDETYKVADKYDNGTEKVDLTRVVTTTNYVKDPKTGKVTPVVLPPLRRGPVSVVYESSPDDVHSVETYRVGVDSNTPALIPGDHKLVRLSLEEAILRALANSLDIRVVSYDPAIAREDMTKAAAAFDYTLYGATDRIHNENKQANGFAGTITKQRDWSLGVKQHTVTGADWSLQWAMTRSWDNSGFLRLLTTYYEPTLVLQVTQPLLRNAWPEFNLAQLRIARVNAKISDEQFRDKVEEVITQVISLYWTLRQARQSLQIQQRLLNETLDTYNITLSRFQVDATGATISQIQASVKIREAALITAKEHPRRPAGPGQAAQRSGDHPPERLRGRPHHGNGHRQDRPRPGRPVDHRPEVQPAARAGQAGHRGIRDQRQGRQEPDAAEAGPVGIDGHPGSCPTRPTRPTSTCWTTNYTSYSLGLQFEYPIGNRAALANLHQAQVRADQGDRDDAEHGRPDRRDDPGAAAAGQVLATSRSSPSGRPSRPARPSCGPSRPWKRTAAA